MKQTKLILFALLISIGAFAQQTDSTIEVDFTLLVSFGKLYGATEPEHIPTCIVKHGWREQMRGSRYHEGKTASEMHTTAVYIVGTNDYCRRPRFGTRPGQSDGGSGVHSFPKGCPYNQIQDTFNYVA